MLEVDLECRICNKICTSVMSLVIHLRTTHKLKPRDYYDKYLKNKDEEVCLECNNMTNFVSISKGYNKYCSTKCSYKSNSVKEKRKKTFLKKYNVENPGQNKEIKEKIKQTNTEKYGGTGFQVKELLEKSKETIIKKYGVEHPIQNKEIKEKIKKTNLEKYGVENVFQNEKIKEKIKQIHLEKYGVENVGKNKEIIEKIKQKKLDKMNYKINILFDYLNLELISEYERHNVVIEVRCKICNLFFETNYAYLQQGYGKCPKCHPRYISSGEKELYEFIKSLNIDTIENDRNIIKPYELDTYIPSKNTAIEFNGLYWHSDGNGKDKNYHIYKTEECLKNNIQLIHIFEDEWIFKQDIVKSRLKQILNLNNSIRIHARKCEIKEISSKVKNLFLNKYHIQGEDRSLIKLGAFYNDELISVMTFSKGSISKGNKSKELIYELNRFCSNNNYHIPGIASKLLTYFKRNYEWKEIFSYADRRWSGGNLYEQIGFKLEHITKPNYWYVKGLNRIHRFNLRKRPDEPKDIPEWILRVKDGYYRIWDCGHYKFVLKKEN